MASRDTPRGVSPALRGACANLLWKRSKAALSYSTHILTQLRVIEIVFVNFLSPQCYALETRRIEAVLVLPALLGNISVLQAVSKGPIELPVQQGYVLRIYVEGGLAAIDVPVTIGEELLSPGHRVCGDIQQILEFQIPIFQKCSVG